MANYSNDAALHRSNLLSMMGNSKGIIYLKGETHHTRRWTDVEFTFRQESYFYYLTGTHEADAHLIIDISKSKSYLFVPEYDDDHALWCGKAPSTSQISQKCGIDVYYTKEMSEIVSKIETKMVHVLFKDQVIGNSIFNGWNVSDDTLKVSLDECRVYKTPGEIQLMEEAARITAIAHIQVMKNVNQFKNECEGSALFHYECAKQGAVFQAYTPIFAVGRNGSVLHYVANNSQFPTNLSDMLLVDAGCEFSCYASDVTRTYPINGKFDEEYKIIYQIVLDSQEAVLKSLKSGIEWEDMHRLAERVILNGLIRTGIVHGDYQELIKSHISALFFPHGLGHLIGLDVHDVGGYPPGVERIAEPAIRYLRMRRTLKANMVVTVEPGLYFIDQVLDKALKDPQTAKFINSAVLEKFRNIGGVRIEDDVLILENGIKILTREIPKSIQDIEKLMSK